MAYKRKKYYGRSQIGYDVKQRVLEKSNCLCGRCGTPISIVDKTFTLEHVVPLSQGGTNDEDNLVGLCLDCNKEKGELVITQDLDKYYKYLKPEELEHLLKYIEWYKESFSTIDFNTWLPSDLMEVRLGKSYSIISRLAKKRFSGMSKQYLLMLNSACVLKKVMYEDMEDVLSFYKSLEYSSHLSIVSLEDDLMISFLLGSIYALYNSSNEIVGCFGVCLCDHCSIMGSSSVIIPEITNFAAKKNVEFHLLEGLFGIFSEMVRQSSLEICMTMVSVANKPKNANLIYLLSYLAFKEFDRVYKCEDGSVKERSGGDIGFCLFYTKSAETMSRIMKYQNAPMFPKLCIKEEDSDIENFSQPQNEFLSTAWDARVSYLKETLAYSTLEDLCLKEYLTPYDTLQAYENAKTSLRKAY